MEYITREQRVEIMRRRFEQGLDLWTGDKLPSDNKPSRSAIEQEIVQLVAMTSLPARAIASGLSHAINFYLIKTILAEMVKRGCLSRCTDGYCLPSNGQH